MRILVVSEDADERRRVTNALGLVPDAQVEEVDTAAAARRRVLVEGARFDVLVVDGDLAPRGGYGLCYDLRARAEMGTLPAARSVLLGSRDQDAWLARWAGANELVRKPVDPFDLARRIQALRDAPLAPYGDDGAAAQQVGAAIADHG